MIDRRIKPWTEIAIHAQHKAVEEIAFRASVKQAIIIPAAAATLADAPLAVGESVGRAHKAVVVNAHYYRYAIFPQDRQDGNRHAIEHQVYVRYIGSFLLYQ